MSHTVCVYVDGQQVLLDAKKGNAEHKEECITVLFAVQQYCLFFCIFLSCVG